MDNDICTPKMKGYSEEKEVGKEKDGVEQSSTRSRSGVLISLKAYFKAKKKKKRRAQLKTENPPKHTYFLSTLHLSLVDPGNPTHSCTHQVLRAPTQILIYNLLIMD